MKNNRSAITVLILLFVIHTNSHAASQTWLGGDDNWLGNVLFWSSGIFPRSRCNAVHLRGAARQLTG